MTSYGGRDHGTEVADGVTGRTEGRGTGGARARRPRGAGSTAGGDSGPPHRTIGPVRLRPVAPSVSGMRPAPQPSSDGVTQLSGGSTRPWSDLIRPEPSTESSCAYPSPPAAPAARSPPRPARPPSSWWPPGCSPCRRSVAAADGLTMEAKVLLDGNTRTGSWTAIEVHVRNDGPAITGELRLAGGTQGQTQYGTAVDLPTGSDQTHYPLRPAARVRARDHGQPRPGRPARWPSSKAASRTTTRPSSSSASSPSGRATSSGGLHLLPNQNNVAPLTFGLTPTDLPLRVEAWGALDRLVWQDTDASTLGQRAARRAARLGRRWRSARHRRRHLGARPR